MEGLVAFDNEWPRSIAVRCGIAVLSLANAVWPSSAHVIALSKTNSSSCLVLALALLAATRHNALAQNLLVYMLVCDGISGGCCVVDSFLGGSVAKAGNVRRYS